MGSTSQFQVAGASKTKKQISSSGTWIVWSKRTRVPCRVSSSAAERAAAKAWRSSVITIHDMALRRSGRLIVIVAT